LTQREGPSNPSQRRQPLSHSSIPTGRMVSAPGEIPTSHPQRSAATSTVYHRPTQHGSTALSAPAPQPIAATKIHHTLGSLAPSVSKDLSTQSMQHQSHIAPHASSFPSPLQPTNALLQPNCVSSFPPPQPSSTFFQPNNAFPALSPLQPSFSPSLAGPTVLSPSAVFFGPGGSSMSLTQPTGSQGTRSLFIDNSTSLL